MTRRHDGDDIEAYTRSIPDGGRALAAGFVVIHTHARLRPRVQGDRARRFAELGYDADLPQPATGATPPARTPDDAAAAGRSQAGGVPDDRLVGDVARRPPPTCARCPPPTARSRRSATARAAASPCWPPATSTWTRRSTATGPSSPAPTPEGFPLHGDSNLKDPAAAEPARPAARPVRQRGQVPPSPEARSNELEQHPQGQRQAATSSTATTAPATRSSPPTARPTDVEAAIDGWERIEVVLRAPISPPDPPDPCRSPEETSMCTYRHRQHRGRPAAPRARERQLVPTHRRHRLFRPPRPCAGRAHAQHRLRRTGPGCRAQRVAVELTAASAPRADGRHRQTALDSAPAENDRLTCAEPTR